MLLHEMTKTIHFICNGCALYRFVIAIITVYIHTPSLLLCFQQLEIIHQISFLSQGLPREVLPVFSQFFLSSPYEIKHNRFSTAKKKDNFLECTFFSLCKREHIRAFKGNRVIIKLTVIVTTLSRLFAQIETLAKRNI